MSDGREVDNPKFHIILSYPFHTIFFRIISIKVEIDMVGF
jgi:hypothetical protein